MDRIQQLKDIIRQRVMVLDGAMGTMIQKYQLSENDFRCPDLADIPGQLSGDNDVLNITRPDVIADIHRKYLEVGADMISTNTFNAQRISQADYHLGNMAAEMAEKGARIARKTADEFSTTEHPRFVLGSVGPTNKTCSMSPDVSDPAARDITYDQLFDAYSEQIGGLIRGGVDAILIETIFDTLNAKVAIDAAMQVMKTMNLELPIMLSVTISDLAGRTLSGQTLQAFMASISNYPIFSVGLNCSFGATQMLPYLRELSAMAPYYVSAYPNAGLPNSLGEYDETPESMAAQVKPFIDEQLVNIIGGCCGTTEKFIQRYVPMVKGAEPRKPAKPTYTIQLSGLELLNCSPEVPFINVGERCNVAGSRKFLQLIKEHQYNEALSIARKQVDDGAMVIDVNMDDALLDAKHEMVTFLNMIASEPDIATVPVMIDSSKWEVITAGLKCLQGKGIVNSISLKEGEQVFLQKARDVMRYGAAVVVMCFDEEGQATTFNRRIAIAQRAYQLLTNEVGMNPHDIIFDPNILAVATGIEEHNAYAADFIHATAWIKEHLPGAHVSGGVSNLSFAFRGNNELREAMHAVFLYHAIIAGMDFGIVNPASKVAYADIPDKELAIIEDVILNRHAEAADRLTELAQQMLTEKERQKETAERGEPTTRHEAWRDDTVENRLIHALQKGIGDYLEDDLHQALNKYPHAVDIIEGPLMTAMNRVGKLFGQGKMFLPQVVKTARTMKQAVAILQPYIESEKKETAAKRGKILLATVKGDVHDIGKNIVAVIMACNNYEVIDMGVMVPPEQIVKKAIDENVDLIGLSGLITPSLEEMANVAKAMEKAHLHIPIMIGGATTSETHVALKIAPEYQGIVIWMKDASQNPLAAAKLLDNVEALVLKRQLEDNYHRLREQFHEQQKELLSMDEARKNRPHFFDDEK